MSRRPQPGGRTPSQSPQKTTQFRSDDPPAPATPRPAIWAEGKQAPAFAPRAFAEAGMLLAREDASLALDYLSTGAAAQAARTRDKDWRLESRFGRLGRVLPTAPGVARSLDALAGQADAARRLLYGQPAPAIGAPLPPRQAAAPVPPPPPTPLQPLPLADPDLAAIRAVLHAPPGPVPPRRPAPGPAHWETPLRAETAPVLRRVLDWGVIRVLAGGVLVFATPIGYGRALYRHLDGADLREIVADCHRMRIN